MLVSIGRSEGYMESTFLSNCFRWATCYSIRLQIWYVYRIRLTIRLTSFAGLLGVANESGLSVYTLDLEDELLIWTRKWFIRFGPHCSPRPILELHSVPARIPLYGSLPHLCILQRSHQYVQLSLINASPLTFLHRMRK